MKLTINGAEAFVSTGGRAFDPQGEVLLFIHGSGQSHLTWLLQARFMANRGYQVLAPDLPGHGHSQGEPLNRIQDMADWCQALLEALGVGSATVIGHSQGCLIGVELARRHPASVSKLALIAGALAIPVNDWLVTNARDKTDRAIAAMMDWGFGLPGDFHDNTVPGMSHVNFGSALMRANAQGALFADLSACQAYDEGEAAAASLTCPSICILAEKDKMTPAKAGRAMAAAVKAQDCLIVPGAGHMLPAEEPKAVNAALRAFFNPVAH